MPDAAIVGLFSSEAALAGAARTARDAGYRILDAYAAYPVEALHEAVAAEPSRLPLVTLAAGAAGAGAAFAFELYASAADWVLDVGGKPPNSWPAFVPIAFEIGILAAATATVAAFLIRSGLLPGATPTDLGAPVTDDRFALVLDRPHTEAERLRAEDLLAACGADAIRQIEGRR